MATASASPKLYYIGILKKAVPTHEICSEKELSSYSIFERSAVSQFLTFFSSKVTEEIVSDKTTRADRQDLEHENNAFHVYCHPKGVVGIVITNLSYPKMSAHRLLSKVLDEFVTMYPASSFAGAKPTLTYPKLKEYITEYQNPAKADNLLQIQEQLDETKIVLRDTINSVLQRGEKLDQLVAKSDGLSMASKAFYTQAKKQNSCCIVM